MILKIAIKKTPTKVAYCALTTNVGTVDEPLELNGLAHFTEHMLFKGTTQRGAKSINNVLESVGGELNAYTTKEETVLHATVLKEDLPKAINLLFEIAFTSTFPKDELIKEREIILDEIISYKDSPSDTIYDDFETMLFHGHPLAMPILGDKISLKRVKQSDFKEYLNSHYQPDKMCFTVVSDLDSKKIKAITSKALKKYFHHDVDIVIVEEGDAQFAGKKTSIRLTDNNNALERSGRLTDFVKPFYKETSIKSHQAHCIIGTTAYSSYDKKRVALAVLTNIIGGPASGSKLNQIMREKYALVYNVEANYTSFSDTGIFSIYFGCDKNDLQRCISLIKKELSNYANIPISTAALKSAKRQLIGQLSIAQDNMEAQCLSMGKSLIVYGKIEPLERTIERVEAITAEQLLEVAKEVLSWERMSTLIFN